MNENSNRGFDGITASARLLKHVERSQRSPCALKDRHRAPFRNVGLQTIRYYQCVVRSDKLSLCRVIGQVARPCGRPGRVLERRRCSAFRRFARSRERLLKACCTGGQRLSTLFGGNGPVRHQFQALSVRVSSTTLLVPFFLAFALRSPSKRSADSAGTISSRT